MIVGGGETSGIRRRTLGLPVLALSWQSPSGVEPGDSGSQPFADSVFSLEEATSPSPLKLLDSLRLKWAQGNS